MLGRNIQILCAFIRSLTMCLAPISVISSIKAFSVERILSTYSFFEDLIQVWGTEMRWLAPCFLLAPTPKLHKAPGSGMSCLHSKQSPAVPNSVLLSLLCVCSHFPRLEMQSAVYLETDKWRFLSICCV